MLLFIKKTIQHVIATIALIALTILIWFPSTINLIPDDCRTILAQPAELPYHVSIQFNGKHHCSGCLIGPKHVLTSAYCVDNPIADSVPDPRMKVVIGTRKLPGGTICNVSKVTRHDLYDSLSKEDDIAVVRLENEVVESRYVRIIKLPEPEQIVRDGQKLIVSGFGPYGARRSTSRKLKKLIMKAVDNNTCKKHFPYQYDPDERFCAVLPLGYASCQAESGSPATVNKEYVIGIFSDVVAGSGCETGVPELFTYVVDYLDFIRDEMRKT